MKKFQKIFYLNYKIFGQVKLDLILGNKYLINNLEEAETLIDEYKGE
jgi:hypothetical protein